MKQISQLLLLLVSAVLLSFQPPQESDWKVVKKQNGVILSKSVVVCHDEEARISYLVFKLENTGNKPVRVDFTYQMIKDAKPVFALLSDVSPSVDLGPGQVLEGKCSLEDDSKLTQFLSDTPDVRKFDDIVLTSFNVTAK